MVAIRSKSAFRSYCIQQFATLHHPYAGASEGVYDADIEAACDVFESVGAAESASRQFSGIEEQFYSAFWSYLTLPRSEIANICVVVDRIASLIDPFLKKVALHFWPDRRIKQVRNEREETVLLWKVSNYAHILEALGIMQVSVLRNDKDEFWQGMPSRQAILRRGFTFRHRGVHESRILALWELEAAAYAVIGQYLVVCLYLVRDPQLRKPLRYLTEKTRAIHLLRDRVRSFPLTNNLLSKKEHVLLYKYRHEFEPDASEKKFLFLNSLAGRGPIAFWLQGEAIETILKWTEEYYNASQEYEVRRACARLIIKSGRGLPLGHLLELFSEYADKAELASYIPLIPGDNRKLLLPLTSGKREEVTLEATKAFVNCCSRADDFVERLALSQSTSKISLLRKCVPILARPEMIDRYRSFVKETGLANRIISGLCLGEVGTRSDLAVLESACKNARLALRLRDASAFARLRIADRFKDGATLLRAIGSRESKKSLVGLEASTRRGLGGRIRSVVDVAERGEVHRRAVSSLLLRTCIEKDRGLIKGFLRRHGIDNSTRDSLLALCRVGSPDDCRFILNQILHSQEKIELFNHVRIAQEMGRLCDASMLPSLRRYLRSARFWEYVFPQTKLAHDVLPIKQSENLPLFRRIVAACFVAVAQSRDEVQVCKLLKHNYDWIALKAREGIARIGTSDTLNRLIRMTFETNSSNVEGHVVGGLSDLDLSLYWPKGGQGQPE